MLKGQVALEAALVIPLTIFTALGIVQLALVQHARLMTEYAAFQAARAGVVWNGSTERMHDAAVMALLPTLGRTDDWGAIAKTWSEQQRKDRALRALPWGAPKTEINGVSLTGQVRVDTVNPSSALRYGWWKLAAGADWEELDFDGPESYPEVRQLEAHVAKLFSLTRPDADEVAFREATLLQIRVRYLYELKVPFLSQALFLAWYAANADVALYGAVDRSSTAKQNALGRDATVDLRDRGRGIGGGRDRGLPAVTPAEMTVLWDLSRDRTERRCFLPLEATHSMRMQSNFYRKWRLH